MKSLKPPYVAGRNECKMLQPLCKTVWQCLRWLNTGTIWLRSFIPKIIPKSNESICPHKDSAVHSSIIRRSQKAESAKHPPVYKWTYIIRSILMGHDLTIKSDEVLIPAIMCTILKTWEPQNTAYCLIPLKWDFQGSDTHTQVSERREEGGG